MRRIIKVRRLSPTPLIMLESCLRIQCHRKLQQLHVKDHQLKVAWKLPGEDVLGVARVQVARLWTVRRAPRVVTCPNMEDQDD